MKDDVSLKSILGLPFVPPGRLTRRAINLRGRVLKTHRNMAPAAVRVLEGLFGLFDNRVLGLLVELGIPDQLTSPASVDDLAAITDTRADALERVLRYAAGRGFLEHGKDGLFRSNAVTDVLRRTHPNSWVAWVEFASSDWFWGAWRASDASLDGSVDSGMKAATGSSFFEFVTAKRPDAGDVFDRAMEAGATMQGLALSHSLSWDGIGSVCDVGGGTGAALKVMIERHEHLNGVLFDLPSVVRKARPSQRLTLVPGDFFTTVPPGCDRYLMLAVIHDWNDEEAVGILSNVASAMSGDARAFVVENELATRARGEFVEASDLMMMVLGSGRERTRAQFDALFERAGMTVQKIHILPTGFTAFELAASPT